MTKELSYAAAFNDALARTRADAQDLDAARRAREALMAERIRQTVPDDIRFEPFDLGGVTGEIVRSPYDAERRIVIYVRGGAWTYGSAAESREVAGRIARSGHTTVYTVAYRLAPENPAPAAVEDVLAVYRALLDGGRDAREIGFIGDSTGAGLVLSALLLAKRDGLPQPGGAVLTSPVVDLTDLPPVDADADWTVLVDSVAGYLGTTRPEDPVASPALGDLSGLPPVMIQVGTADPAHAQGRRLADTLSAAGVAVALREWEGMFHSWQVFPHVYDAGRASNQAAEFLLQRNGAGCVPVAPS